MSRAILAIFDAADVPGSKDAFCKPMKDVSKNYREPVLCRGKERRGRRHVRVLIVSIGALENGPIAPDIRPMIMAW